MAILVIISIGRYISSPESLISLLLTIPAMLIAITFHEFAHAFAADKLGDDTPRRQGRLNLNPLSHLDPIGSIMLVFAGFGWGKPVEINPRNFNKKISMSAGEAIVSFAGPLMNFILAIVFTIIMCLILKFAPAFAISKIGMIIVLLVQQTVIINIGLGIFNLIPLPPLDGSKILIHFLPYKAKDWFERNSYIFYIVFMALWFTGIMGSIISPVINVIYNGITGGIGSLFGII
ncbi:MAG: site-2 protease family protein [Clostridia bacterium]|nr:site-2 protease family protein [Clostridia bacterium]